MSNRCCFDIEVDIWKSNEADAGVRWTLQR